MLLYFIISLDLNRGWSRMSYFLFRMSRLVCHWSVVLVENLLGDAKFLHKNLSFLTSQARCILLVPVPIASLRPASSAVGTWEWSFIFVKSYVIFQTAKFTESFMAAFMFACPNAIHPICRFVSFILYYVIWEITSLEFARERFLLNHFAHRCLRVSSIQRCARFIIVCLHEPRSHKELFWACVAFDVGYILVVVSEESFVGQRVRYNRIFHGHIELKTIKCHFNGEASG